MASTRPTGAADGAADAAGLDAGASDAVARGDGALDDLRDPSDSDPGIDSSAPADLSAPADAPAPADVEIPVDIPSIASGAPGPIDDPCQTLTPTIRGTPADRTIHGTPGRDVIFAFGASYTIDGGDGDDVICTGAGSDVVSGGAGDDYIDTGLGNDTVHGDAGHDIIHGRGGSDTLYGGDGNDVLFGDLLDDDLYGEAGNDVLIGSHGTDYLHGGPGNDWLRGDTGHDTFVGGEGIDTVSFMTAAPPLGGGLAAGDEAFDGVVVDLTAHLTPADGATQALQDHSAGDLVASAGVATGDGYREAVVGVERIVGSAFRDRLVGNADTLSLIGGYGDDSLSGPSRTGLEGGPGNDTCLGGPCDSAGEPPGRPAGPFVFGDDSGDDLGLVVLGATGVADDSMTIAMSGTSVRITAAAGTNLVPGPLCVRPAPGATNVAQCALPHAFRYVLGDGGDGNDAFTITGAMPRDLNAHLYGGNGDDTLVGAAGDDVLFSGPTGRDTLRGNGGDDALLSESASPVQTTRGVDYRDGPDTLDGGGGNDQLVADYPCGGHHFIGGDGVDIAGFRRSSPAGLSSYQGITAQLGGGLNDPSHAQPFHGRAFMPGLCAFDPYGTTLAGDLEILEAGEGDDHLYGNDADIEIDCGGGGTLADRDPGDPPAMMCR